MLYDDAAGHAVALADRAPAAFPALDGTGPAAGLADGSLMLTMNSWNSEPGPLPRCRRRLGRAALVPADADPVARLPPQPNGSFTWSAIVPALGAGGGHQRDRRAGRPLRGGRAAPDGRAGQHRLPRLLPAAWRRPDPDRPTSGTRRASSPTRSSRRSTRQAGSSSTGAPRTTSIPRRGDRRRPRRPVRAHRLRPHQRRHDHPRRRPARVLPAASARSSRSPAPRTTATTRARSSGGWAAARATSPSSTTRTAVRARSTPRRCCRTAT